MQKCLARRTIITISSCTLCLSTFPIFLSAKSTFCTHPSNQFYRASIKYTVLCLAWKTPWSMGWGSEPTFSHGGSDLIDGQCLLTPHNIPKCSVEHFALIMTFDFKPPMRQIFFYRRGIWSINKLVGHLRLAGSKPRQLEPQALRACLYHTYGPFSFGNIPFFISLLRKPYENSIQFFLCLNS